MRRSIRSFVNLENVMTPDQEKAFEERMAKRKEEADKREKEEAERLRQDYLKRTGRSRMKP